MGRLATAGRLGTGSSLDGEMASSVMYRAQGQDLAPYEKFARMIGKHWHGIAAYCKPENNVASGFVEGFSNKIRLVRAAPPACVTEEYLDLKIRTLGLPQL